MQLWQWLKKAVVDQCSVFELVKDLPFLFCLKLRL